MLAPRKLSCAEIHADRHTNLLSMVGDLKNNSVASLSCSIAWTMGSVLPCCHDLSAMASWMGSCAFVSVSSRSAHPAKSTKLKSAKDENAIAASRED